MREGAPTLIRDLTDLIKVICAQLAEVLTVDHIRGRDEPVTRSETAQKCIRR